MPKHNTPPYDENIGINLYETIFDTDSEAMMIMELIVAHQMDGRACVRDLMLRLNRHDFVRHRYRLFYDSIRFIVENSDESVTPRNILTIAELMAPDEPELEQTMKDMLKTADIQGHIDEITFESDNPFGFETVEDRRSRRITRLKTVTRRREIVNLAYDIITSAVKDEPINKPLGILAAKYLPKRTGRGTRITSPIKVTL